MSDSALVIGGGIAGVQAALNLADAGVRVYLVERSPSLGGRMAQLDKTFPTNDCSTCILSPKLVEAVRHPNIHILTCSEVVSLSGEAPDFNVKVKKYPRFIDEKKCTACNLCTEVCPVEVESEFDCGLTNRKAIYIPFPQAVPLKYKIDRRGIPPCQAACPAGVHAQAYIALISEGKYKEALDVHREYNPLPLICGRVCPHPCETECNRGSVDDPVTIAALKRFMADYDLHHRESEVEPFERTLNKKVAIIGSGPAGLSAAYYLAKMGHEPTIFEALPVAGGMMAVGIPDYRLPKDILAAEIDYIKKKGVDIRLNVCLGKDIDLDELKNDGYEAVFLAIGAHKSKKLAIEGEELNGVIPGVDFLRDVNLGNNVNIGKKVAVIGGGDVAIDAARVASRLGSEAFILYRRTRAEMPAHDSEIEETIKEGIEISYLVQPVKILAQSGRVVGLECIRMELGEPDESGRQRPVPLKDSEFIIDVDAVIPAIGQEPDFTNLENLGLEISRTSSIVVDPATSITKIPGLFAAGDVTTGPATVVSAVNGGRRAAEAIEAYLRGEKLEIKDNEEHVVAFEELQLDEDHPRENRIDTPEIPLPERNKNFQEVVHGISEGDARKEATRCLDCGVCSGCYRCITVCEPDAIDFSQEEEIIELKPGSIIVATGFDQFDPSALKEYGYGQYKDVLTALEFERLLSASGPTEGHIVRPSNREVPKSITFIQCVGSRDENHNPYCSRVCCMYAIKEAMLAKEHEDAIKELNILYMDVRTFGKGFEEYYTRARDDTGLHFLRGRVAEIMKTEDDGTLIVRYEDTEGGDTTEIVTDMIVLSSALVPSSTNPKLADVLGIELDENGFLKERNPIIDPVSSSKDGIFTCGCAQGPKDIPDSVAQAQAASAKAVAFVKERKTGEEISADIPVDEKAGISDEKEPRIGVFVCNCGINIGKVVDVGAVAAYAQTLPHVVEAQENLFTCSESTQHKIQEAIEVHDLNRVVVAACTPRTHEPLFRETCEAAGVNPYLFEMANIREHCSWVHAKDREKATEKAKDLIEMACARAVTLRPLTPRIVDITQSALVIGGGIAGMQAALDVSAQGIPTFLVEKEERLGGKLNELHTLSFIRESASEILERKLAELQASQVTVFANSEIGSIDGFVGNFDVTVKSKIKGKKEKTHTLRMGAIIMAIGSEIIKPEGKYDYGKHPNIITNLELEGLLKQGKFDKDSIAFTFILCVGAREKEGYTGCSRYCCQVAIKQAVELKDLGHNVNVLYRDIRTFDKGAEEMYREASRRGIGFIRYKPDRPPQIKKEARAITVHDSLLQQDIALDNDYTVLVVPMTPPRDGEKFQEMLKIPRGPMGFFLEQHPKLAPLQTNTEGIFLCGTAQGPKNVTDTIAQASGTASRAIALLSKKQLIVEAATACVDETMCWGCGTCVDLCEFGAPQLVTTEASKTVSQINEALCKGCGMCAVYCPSGALSPQHFTREQILKMIEAFGGSSLA